MAKEKLWRFDRTLPQYQGREYGIQAHMNFGRTSLGSASLSMVPSPVYCDWDFQIGGNLTRGKKLISRFNMLASLDAAYVQAQ